MDARVLLQEIFEDEPEVPAEDVRIYLQAKTGISAGRLRRLRLELGIRAERRHTPGKPGVGHWVWLAPESRGTSQYPKLPRSSGGYVVCCPGGPGTDCRLPDAAWHGTKGGYTNHNCRCEECRAAWAEYQYIRKYIRDVLGPRDMTWAEYLTYGMPGWDYDDRPEAWHGRRR